MRPFRTVMKAALVLLLALVPAAASAITTDQIVAMQKAGVSEAVILALIERDGTVFSLQPEQIVALQREGVSEAIILAMVKTGRDSDQAARAESADASASIAASITGPQVLIVGHGPERPNTDHPNGWFMNTLSPTFFVPPYGFGYAPYAGSPYAGRGMRGDRYGAPSLCFAQVNTSASRSASLGFVTTCPPVLQPRHVR